jgi:hypothetical protein
MRRMIDRSPDTSPRAAKHALEIVQRPGMEQFRDKK